MAITYDIYTDGLYLEGKEEGVQLGIDKVIQVRRLLNDGLGEEAISNQTQLSLETVRKIIAAG
ncbi:MAG: hypothetical protein WA960_10930 [Tunicatimonas sp.]